MNNPKFPYEEPSIEVIRFSEEDVITSSGKEVAELEEIED